MAFVVRRELMVHKARTGRDGSELVFGRTATEVFYASTIRVRAMGDVGESKSFDAEDRQRGERVALADRARQELTIAGARPRRDALRGRVALTASELRVAQLAAEGHSNREIAEQLFITLRTVEAHLTSTYGKLGITSRQRLPHALGISAGQ